MNKRGFASLVAVLLILAVLVVGGLWYSRNSGSRLSVSTSNVSSSKLCSIGERLVSVPTSTQLVVDQPAVLCFKPVIGSTLGSPNGEWSVAMESNGKGPVWYTFPDADHGPSIYDSKANVFILLTDLKTGQKSEIGIPSVTPQAAILSIKSQFKGKPVQFYTISEITEWSADGGKVWGRVDIYDAELDGSPPAYQSIFSIDAASSQIISYLLPNDVIGNNVDN